MMNADAQSALEAAQTLLKAKGAPVSISLVGDLALDRFVFGSVDRISPEAPVPVLLVEREVELLGCAANVARNLNELARELPNLSFQIHGVLGKDATAARLRDQLSKLAPSQNHLFLLEDAARPTPLKTRFLAGAQRSQQQLLRVDLESTTPIDPMLQKNFEGEILRELPKSSMLVIQDYAKGLCEPAFLQRLLKKSRELAVKTLVDPNRNTPAEAYRGAWMITPNVEEAEKLLGRSLHKGENSEEIGVACQELKKKLDLSVVVITRSKHGLSLLDESGQLFHAPSMARAVADVVGAGDTVVSVFALCLTMGLSLKDAATLANAAAAVVVEKVGTATASWQEIFRELKR